MANDPISQFEIHDIAGPVNIGGLEFSFTNSALFMGVAVATITGTLLLASRKSALVPDRFQSVAELWYGMIDNMVKNVLGEDGKFYFPLVFSLFSFVLIANLLGMFPYFFTITSQVVVTMVMALFVIGLVIVIGIWKHGLGWFKLFWPSGMHTGLKIAIAPIEIISFLSRPISLGLRLFGNMLAGHIVLKVFSGFVVSLSALGLVGILGAVVPMVMAVALTALEFLVAFLQAYLFAILTCVYLNDAIHIHH